MPPVTAELENAARQNFVWFLKLRWGFLLAQSVVFFAGDRLSHPGRGGPILGIIALECATNVGAFWWLRRGGNVRESTLAIVMAADATLLSLLLFWGGADSNPLAALYLVNVALAVLLVKSGWAWLVALYTLLNGAAVATAKALAPTAQNAGAFDPVEWQMRELWLALAVTGALLVYFLQRTVARLREHERAVAEAHAALEKKDRLASLTTLAAGAAHELASPLSTIAVAAKELQRQLSASGLEGALGDAQLIRAEVDRCRGVLQRLSSRAGAASGDSAAATTVGELLAAALVDFPPERIKLLDGSNKERLEVPRQAFAQAMRALVQNAVDADPAGPILIRASCHDGMCMLEVGDRGPGMSQEIAERAGEPFFTTKEPGKGMGLGVFLARSIAEQLGGTLELASQAGTGTTARLRLPQRPAAK